MSSAKFAAITASLLARKGDATPSVVVPVTPVPRPALVPRDEQSIHSEPRQPENGEKLRRIVVSITQDELERLGIAAIKKGTNRHDIVRAALNNYFRKLSAEFPHPCACMEGGLTALARHAESNGRADHHSYPACAEDLASASGDDDDRRERVGDVMAPLTSLELTKNFLNRALRDRQKINARIRQAGSFATQQCHVLAISRKDVRLQVVDADNIPDSFFILK